MSRRHHDVPCIRGTCYVPWIFDTASGAAIHAIRRIGERWEVRGSPRRLGREFDLPRGTKPYGQLGSAISAVCISV
jgi:hypothetical protein